MISAAALAARGREQAWDDHAKKACAIATDIVDRYDASSPQPYFGSPEKWAVFADQEFEAVYEASQSDVAELQELTNLPYDEEFWALYHWCRGH